MITKDDIKKAMDEIPLETWPSIIDYGDYVKINTGTHVFYTNAAGRKLVEEAILKEFNNMIIKPSKPKPKRGKKYTKSKRRK